jgi:hypothetical protein
VSRDIQTGADMTPRIPENISTWLVDWSLVAIGDDTMPPRDPNDDDEDHDDDEDEDDENQADEPAVVREPDDE